jgi:hypothetical protein
MLFGEIVAVYCENHTEHTGKMMNFGVLVLIGFNWHRLAGVEQREANCHCVLLKYGQWEHGSDGLSKKNAARLHVRVKVLAVEKSTQWS